MGVNVQGAAWICADIVGEEGTEMLDGDPVAAVEHDITGCAVLATVVAPGKIAVGFPTDTLMA